MALIPINGEKIWIEDSGGDKPAVIFCHGFFLDGSMFDLQVASLLHQYRCITWDERGFGQSSAHQSFSYWDSAADALAILDYCSVERAVFVGMSKGGYIAMRAALTSPARAAALVLIGSESGVFTEEEKAGFADWVRLWQKTPLSAEVRDAVAKMLFGASPVSQNWYTKWERSDRRKISYPADALIKRDDISNLLPKINCPSLVIHGAADAGVGVEKGRKLAAGLRSQNLVVEIPEGPHAVNVTHPEIVNEALIEFLTRIRF